MKLLEIKVKTYEEAINIVLSHLPDKEIKAYTCFTGGKFGLKVIQAIKGEKIDISNLTIFQTDERVESEPEEVIQSKFIKNLKSCKGFNLANFNFFSYKSFDEEVFNDLSNKIVKIKILKKELIILKIYFL